MSGNTIVLYHDSCADGFGAAWSAWRSMGDSAVYIPVQYGQPPPPEAVGAARLFILDFSYDRATLEALAGAAGEILVLDHHATAEKELAGLPYARFDMGKSGAVLAWEHFHPGKPVPLLLRYVQDRDLWAWELERSREFSAALWAVDRTFAAWNELDALLESDPTAPDRICDGGRCILDAQSKHVASLCDKAFWTEIAGHRVPAVNSPLFQSEIGEELCRRHPDAPFAAIFFRPNSAEEVWSLRSRNGFDVSEVARSLGGGGHKAAAGFKVARGAVG